MLRGLSHFLLEERVFLGVSTKTKPAQTQGKTQPVFDFQSIWKFLKCLQAVEAHRWPGATCTSLELL
ncbi:hypothetical protein sync_1625 [Synechococcus sp. CC9311]|nr:hypothetical protein sync_1625 [Synechococcus sp. CC9311]